MRTIMTKAAVMTTAVTTPLVFPLWRLRRREEAASRAKVLAADKIRYANESQKVARVSWTKPQRPAAIEAYLDNSYDIVYEDENGRRNVNAYRVGAFAVERHQGIGEVVAKPEGKGYEERYCRRLYAGKLVESVLARAQTAV